MFRHPLTINANSKLSTTRQMLQETRESHTMARKKRTPKSKINYTKRISFSNTRCVDYASYNAAPHNRYQPHPTKPEQYNKCSNRAFDLLKMVIMMPETC